MTTIDLNMPLGPKPTDQLERKNVRNDKAQVTDTTSANISSNQSDIAKSQDALSLSEDVITALQEAEFDHKKVEDLRSAIARGAYPLDTMKIADKFIELEKLL